MGRRNKSWEIFDAGEEEDRVKREKEIAEEKLRQEEKEKARIEFEKSELLRLEKEKEEEANLEREKLKERKRLELEEKRKEERRLEEEKRKAKERNDRIQREKEQAAIDKKKQELEKIKKEKLQAEKKRKIRENEKIKKQEEIRSKREIRRIVSEADKVTSDINPVVVEGDSIGKDAGKETKKVIPSPQRKWLILLLLLFLTGIGYLISCYVCGYCLKTAISEQEIARYIEVGDTQGNSAQNEARDIIESSLVKEPTIWYADTDGDGYIDLTDKIESIEQPYGYLDRDNPIDDCPNERGPACTNGCLDSNSNCIADKEEVRSTDSDDDISETYVSDGKYSDVELSKPKIQSNDAKEESRIQESVPLKVYTWFLDQDDDKKGDPATVKETNDGNPPEGGNWVPNSDDQCPARKAVNLEDGCPELQILMVTDLASVSSPVTVTAILKDSKSADEFEWSSNELKFSVQKGEDTEVTSDYVGKFRMVLDVFNPTDQFASSATERIAFTVSKARLSSELQALAEYGNTGKTGRTKSILDDKTKSLDFIHNSILNKDISLIKLVQGEKVSYTYKKLENQILSAKRDASTYVNSISVVDIEYDPNSGKIKGFTFKQL